MCKFDKLEFLLWDFLKIYLDRYLVEILVAAM